MAEITYKALKTKLRRAIWVFPGEGKSLVTSHDAFFTEAMVELSKWVKALQLNNTTEFPACSMLLDCGLSVADVPFGKIRRVFSIANEEWCDKVFYWPLRWGEIQSWQESIRLVYVDPGADKTLPALPQGHRYVSVATDSALGRARACGFAINRKRIYAAPWLQSNESLVVEWDGPKTEWGENDVIDQTYWTVDAEKAIKLYVQYCHERDFGSDRSKMATFRVDYDIALAELMYWSREFLENIEVEQSGQHMLPTKAQLDDDAIVADGSIVIAAFGDSGVSDTTAAQKVSDLVHGWKPAAVLALGDLYYNGNATSYDDSIGRYYHDFISPYSGAFGDGAADNLFLEGLGNHDRDPVVNLTAYHNFFRAHDGQNYYDQLIGGMVHVFMMDSGYDNSQVNQEADGNDINSKQAEWLKAKLLLSPAAWKLVFVHHPPYTSTPASDSQNPVFAMDGTLSYPSLRWGYAGAHLILSGHCHNYERLKDANGLTYLIAGTGGHTLVGFLNPPLAISQVRYNGDYGALKLTVTCSKLIAEFYNTAGVLIDTVTLTK